MSDHVPHERRNDRLGRIEHVLKKLAEQQYQLTQRQSLRKNGESWMRYLGKVFTLDRILLLIVLIYQFGGQVQSYKTQLANLVEARTAVIQQQAAVTEQVAVQKRITETQGESVAQLIAETNRLALVVGHLDDQMKLTITRSELKDAVDGRLIPRLERIEHAVNMEP